MGVGIYSNKFIILGLKRNTVNYSKIIVICAFITLFSSSVVVLAFHLDQFVDEFILSATNLAQNPFYLIYLVTAIAFTFLILLSESVLVQFMLSIGKIYIFASLVGFVIFGPQTTGLFISVMNLGLGVSSITVGKLLQEYRQSLLVARIIAKRRETSCTVTTLIKNGGFNKAVKFQMEQIPAN